MGPGINSRERVHIAPFGYESDRIVLAAVQLNAERVVLLERPDDDEPDWFADVREALRAEGITVDREPCEIMDMYAAIEGVGRVAQRHASDDVYVNLSTGGKLSAIGGMIACMALGNATPYYVQPSHYGAEDRGPEPLSHGVESIEQLTGYPIEAPTREQIWILAYLDSMDAAGRDVLKKDLIAFGKGSETTEDGHAPPEPLPFISEYSDTKTAHYRTLNDRILSPLAEKDRITIASEGKQAHVRITPQGTDTLRAFRHLIDLPTDDQR